MSMAMRSYLVTWLSKWLQIDDFGELGQVEIQVHSETVSRIDFSGSGTTQATCATAAGIND
jgi:hypothetical protein